ncbi:MAG: hypothetical protein LBU90_00500 [Bacteroidales bacterium]|nr:hypothetical protein [Bacteroidales bacterium]
MIQKIFQTSEGHQWHFARIGGANRVLIENAQDLLHLRSLDQKLWTALSCPANNLMIDAKTMQYIDTDNDGRIRVPEILAAVEWLCSLVANPQVFFTPSDTFVLADFNENNADAVMLKNSALQILDFLEADSTETISSAQTANVEQLFVNSDFNGDGVITALSTEREDLKKAIETIIACVGSKTDRCGLEGVNEDLLKEFFTECEQYLQWRSNAGESMTYGNETADLYTIFSAVKEKINDYFFQCKFAQYRSEFAQTELPVNFAELLQNPHETELQAVVNKLPISPISPAVQLSFTERINPAWEQALTAFYTRIFAKEYKQTVMTEAQWIAIQQKFEKYTAWLAQKQGTKVEQLDVAQIADVKTLQEPLYELVVQDNAQKQNVDTILLVDKFIRLRRDIVRILRNFVTFHEFYNDTKSAIFTNGTLFIDQRSCSLCIPVQNVDTHVAMASNSKMFLLYCDCTHKQTKEKQSIVAVLTNGDIDNLMVGRNALYYDKTGADWDATVVKIVDNPISIRQAFFTPYRKFAQFISDQIKKFSSSKESAVEANAMQSIESTGENVSTATTAGSSTAPAAATPFDIGKFVGIFAAIGLAIGAIGGVLVSIVSGFLRLKWWEMPLSILALVLIISGPSMLIAWFNLRTRNLGPILDANGWAINARAVINIPFGNTLTDIAQIPRNANIDLHDPFAVKSMAWWKKLLIVLGILAIAFGVLWYFGIIQRWFHIQ